MLLYVRTNMEGRDSSDESTSVSEDTPAEDIASPDPVEDTAVPASSKTFFEDDRSQTPLQDEVVGADEAVDEITGSVEGVDISQPASQQDVTNVDSSKSCDDDVLKQTMHDDPGELDYDEEVQPEACPIPAAGASSPSNTHQKAVDEEEKEDGEEKVGDLVTSRLMLALYMLI